MIWDYHCQDYKQIWLYWNLYCMDYWCLQNEDILVVCRLMVQDIAVHFILKRIRYCISSSQEIFLQRFKNSFLYAFRFQYYIWRYWVKLYFKVKMHIYIAFFCLFMIKQCDNMDFLDRSKAIIQGEPLALPWL